MPTADDLKKQLDEARQRVSDLTRNEYESLPAEEQDDYVAALAEAEAHLEELERKLAESERGSDAGGKTAPPARPPKA